MFCVFCVSDGPCSRKYIEAICKKVVLQILELDRMMKKIVIGQFVLREYYFGHSSLYCKVRRSHTGYIATACAYGGHHPNVLEDTD